MVEFLFKHEYVHFIILFVLFEVLQFISLIFAVSQHLKYDFNATLYYSFPFFQESVVLIAFVHYFHFEKFKSLLLNSSSLQTQIFRLSEFGSQLIQYAQHSVIHFL